MTFEGKSFFRKNKRFRSFIQGILKYRYFFALYDRQPLRKKKKKICINGLIPIRNDKRHHHVRDSSAPILNVLYKIYSEEAKGPMQYRVAKRTLCLVCDGIQMPRWIWAARPSGVAVSNLRTFTPHCGICRERRQPGCNQKSPQSMSM